MQPHLVLCAPDKRPLTLWQDVKPTTAEAAAHAAAGGLVGIVPASIGCLVVDIDHSIDFAADARRVRAIFGGRAASLRTVETPRGRHVWVRAAGAAGNAKWRMTDPIARGDIRCSAGYVICWGGVAAALEWAESAPPVECAAPALTGLLAARRHKGGRNNALNSSVFAGADPVMERARGIADGMAISEITATITSAVTARGEVPTLDDILSDVWYDARSGRVMFGEEYMTDRREASLKLAAVKAGIIKSNLWTDELNNYCMGRELDAFLQYLSALEWDGTNRIDTILHDYFGTADNDYSRWVSQYIFTAAVDRTVAPGSPADHVPVLIGPQGCGKSSFLRELVSRPEWRSTGIHGGMGDKKAVEAIGSAVVCEIPEMAGMTSRDKRWITQPETTIRRAFARHETTVRFRHVLVGTANSEDVIPYDTTGARRWAPVTLTTPWVTVVEDCERLRDQWWAEAYARERGTSAMPPALYPLQCSAAEAARTSDPLESVVASITMDQLGATEPPVRKWDRDWVTSAQIAQAIDRQADIRDTGFRIRVGRALHASRVWERSKKKVWVNGRLALLWRKSDNSGE